MAMQGYKSQSDVVSRTEQKIEEFLEILSETYKKGFRDGYAFNFLEETGGELCKDDFTAIDDVINESSKKVKIKYLKLLKKFKK